MAPKPHTSPAAHAAPPWLLPRRPSPPARLRVSPRSPWSPGSPKMVAPTSVVMVPPMPMATGWGWKPKEEEKRWCLGGLGSLGGKEKDSLTSKAREALQPTKWPTVTPCNENGQTLEAERDVPKDAAAGPKAEENAENAENERVLFTCRDGLPLDYDAVSEETWREFDESLRRLEQAENYLRGMIKGLTMAEGGSERTKAAPLEKKIISRGLVENCPDLVRAPAVAAAGLAANRPFAPGERLVARRPFGEVNLGGAGAGSGSSGFNGLGTKPVRYRATIY